MHKREFVRTAAGLAAGAALWPELFRPVAHLAPAALADDETFWAGVRAKFTLTPDYINLENGFYCFQPDEVLERFVAHVRAINVEASHYMRTRKDADKARVAAKLAAMADSASPRLK